MTNLIDTDTLYEENDFLLRIQNDKNEENKDE